MDCLEAQEFLSAYHDGELVDDQQRQLSEHFDICPKCTREFTKFKALTCLAAGLDAPEAPPHIWAELEKQLAGDSQPSCQEDLTARRKFTSSRIRLFALAACVLIAGGFGWFSYQSWIAGGEHGEFALVFGEYLDEFRRDPGSAQRFLLARYDNQQIEPQQGIGKVGYRPAVANGLPQGYRMVSTHVLEMPCCTCVQSLCERRDGSKLAVFEHDSDETHEWFGDRPSIIANCSNKRCSLVELDAHLAASWRRGARHITLIGVRDTNEISKMIASLDAFESFAPN